MLPVTTNRQVKFDTRMTPIAIKEKIPIYTRLFRWSDLSVGSELEYSGFSYDAPAIFTVTGVMYHMGHRKVKKQGTAPKSRHDHIEVQSGDDVRTLGVGYVSIVAIWSLRIN